jgi:hypothetical protein
MSSMIDIRHVLPAIRVPTLVLHRADEVLAEASRYVGERIPGAKVVELPGDNHMPWLDRVLATVLFTDIVGSTELAADLGDRRWRDLLEQHNTLVRRELIRLRGLEQLRPREGREWYMSNCSRFAPQLSLKNSTPRRWPLGLKSNQRSPSSHAARIAVR